MKEQNPTTPAEIPPPMAMLQMIVGFWVARSIYAAAKLGLADHVKDQAKTAAELAKVTGADTPSLYRLLRALAGVGIFSEDTAGRFAQTPLSETLRSDVPGSLRYFAMTELGEEHFPAWGNLLHSVKTGAIAFDHTFGMPVWEFYAQHPENAKIFNEAMTNLTIVVNEAVLAGYDFSSIRKLVDVGGGHGRLLMSILKTNPSMSGVLFDAPSVVEGAGPQMAVEGLSGRCELRSGDFFQSVPEGGDAYILKWIIHDWDDARATTILKNCHRAMAANGKLLLVESVIPPGNEPFIGKFMDLNMLVMTGGRERTAEEFRTLLSAAGFQRIRILPTASPVSIIEGAKQ